MAGFAHEAEVQRLFDQAVGILAGAGDLGRGDEAAVLAGKAQGLAPGPGDPAHQLLVDRARQDHFRDFRRGLVGDTQTVDEGAFDAQPLEHGADLRAAAVDDHGVDADRLQKHDIAGEFHRRVFAPHGVAPVFHHEGAPGIAPEIGQGLYQRFRLGARGAEIARNGGGGVAIAHGRGR